LLAAARRRDRSDRQVTAAPVDREFNQSPHNAYIVPLPPLDNGGGSPAYHRVAVGRNARDRGRRRIRRTYHYFKIERSRGRSREIDSIERADPDSRVRRRYRRNLPIEVPGSGAQRSYYVVARSSVGRELYALTLNALIVGCVPGDRNNTPCHQSFTADGIGDVDDGRSVNRTAAHGLASHIIDHKREVLV